MNYTPHAYQMKGIEHLVSRPGAALYFDPGMGKTSTTYAAFSILKDEGHTKGMLVVAPLRPANKVWPDEATKWNDFKDLKVVVLHGTKKLDLLKGDADVYVINYEGLAWLETQCDKMKELPFDIMCLDESTKIKHTSTSRYQILRRMRPRFTRFWELTGTPAPNGLMDLFGQIFMLDGGDRLGKFITYFRNQYFHSQTVTLKAKDKLGRTREFTQYFPKHGAKDQIEDALADVALTFKAEDYLKMPKLFENVIEVDLPPKSRKIYNALKTKFIAELKTGVVTAANAAVKGGKLRQIASGGIYGTEGAEGIHNAKIDALGDLIEEQSGQPLLVAVAFKHEVDRIREKLGKDIPYLGGGVSTKDADKIIDDWNAGKLPVVLAHPTSVAHGLNLQAGGNAVCWFSLTCNLEEFFQLNRRVYRQGQKKPVFLHYIVAANTIDIDVLARLREKEATQTSLLDSLRSTL